MITLEGIYKSFHKNDVLNGVSLKLNKHEVISIIGGNGAGKSTLMKILTGVYQADHGEMEIAGEKIENYHPAIAHEKGIYLVPQEPLLFPNMTVEQNITFGFNKSKYEIREETRKLYKTLGWGIDLKRLASSLTIAEQQQLEIIKGLLRNAKVLILDEPTSALTFSETKSLFEVIKKLRDSGVGILYITHRLDEVFEISTHTVILRDGKITLKGNIRDFTKDMLIDGLLPTGSETKHQDIFEKKYTGHMDKPPVLTVENISGDGFRDISFKIYQGEVVGLAGLVGAGRTEIAEAIYGITRCQNGRIILGEKDITKLDINEIVDNGLSYIPEDRFLHGIFPISSVRNNVTVQVVKRKGFFINNNYEKEIADKYIDRLNIKVTDHHQEMKSLSGGNQQKVVISRILSINPHLIIMDEPTRGIDAAARNDIYAIINQLKEIGFSILLISSDLEEIARISDRIYGIYRGTCNAYLGFEDINTANVMKAAFGTYEGSESYVDI
ncbi:ABC transporter ATP-binding protein [Oceanobacillus arenosus]|uniref:Autoinducer 2 import ATP-binding protein LsrA n=1 Tax=Oceanobacillus arenosus TaxID=1229153 RepID=A0A3D8Q254_9BACI|nr:ABC transporter ATP-binding protein [Oceanobacillus arenosus]